MLDDLQRRKRVALLPRVLRCIFAPRVTEERESFPAPIIFVVQAKLPAASPRLRTDTAERHRGNVADLDERASH